MPRGSHVERAEATSQKDKLSWRPGNQALQLRSTQPSSALVTTTTFSASSAACASNPFASRVSSSKARATAPSGPGPSTESPCCRMHVVEGHIVSSQSRMIIVWFGWEYSAELSVDLHERGVMSREIFRSSFRRGEAASSVSISRYGRGTRILSPLSDLHWSSFGSMGRLSLSTSTLLSTSAFMTGDVYIAGDGAVSAAAVAASAGADCADAASQADAAMPGRRQAPARARPRRPTLGCAPSSQEAQSKHGHLARAPAR
mmetsp:Transcript_29276/g.62225  ORF Transcript_29276/g.62225 Transcript_29276/m.62225 type:complete len:259 (+) Transcript_29276:505-1281(+)